MKNSHRRNRCGMSFVSTILQPQSRGKTSHEVRALGGPGQEGRAGDEQGGRAVEADDAWPSRASPRHSIRPPDRPTPAFKAMASSASASEDRQTRAARRGWARPRRVLGVYVQCTGRCNLKMLRDRYECLFRVHNVIIQSVIWLIILLKILQEQIV